MACKPVCQLCSNLVISQSITYDADGLTINLPAGSYGNGGKYCLVLAQTIPATATITAPVFITIGDGTAVYPLLDRCCAPVTACSLRTRTRYSTTVRTSPTGGVFRLLGRGSCAPNYDLGSIDGTAPTTEGGDTT